MMKKISDERLEQMLTDYCEADCSQSFVYDPDRKKEKIIPFARFHKAAVTAASLVLVSVLSMTVYFLIGNKNAPLIAAPPSMSATTPSASADGSGDNAEQQDGTAPTESKSVLRQIIDYLFPQPTESGSAAPTGINPTEKPSRKPTEPSHAPPTERAGEKPTEKPAPQPTDKPVQPTVKPTEPAHEPTAPCDPPWNDEPTEGGSDPDPWEPEETQPPNEGGSPGDEPGYEPPTEGGGGTAGLTTTVCATISSSLLGNNDEWVYCKVYDNSGRRLGSANLYDESHTATILSRGNDAASVEYEVPAGVITQPGFYNFVFYNSSGKRLAQTQEYVG